MTMTNWIAATSLILIIPIVGVTPVYGEESSTTLEEVYVFAQKREENAQDVPFALTAVTADDMVKRNVAVMTDALQGIPNVYVESSVAAAPNISIRGVSSNINNFGIESGVGVAVDDVFLGRPAAFNTTLIDIERIEVLRGPQGTLFGKNTTGGLINIVTKKPYADFDAAADIGAGSFNTQQFRGFVNGTLVEDKVFAKISTSYRKSDGWAEDRTPGNDDLQSEDFWGVRGQLLINASENFSILLSAEISEDDSIQNFQDIIGGALAPLDGNDGEDREIATSEINDFGRDIQGFSAKIEWLLGDYKLVSITSQREVEWNFLNDQDYSAIDFLTTSRVEDQEQFSQEIRIESPGDRALRWVAGLYYFDQDQSGTDAARLGFDTLALVGAPAFPGYEESSATTSEIDSKATAAYFSMSWDIVENFTLAAGVRYTDEDKDLQYQQDVTLFEVAPGFPIGIILAFAQPVPQLTQNYSEGEASWDLSGRWAVNDDINIYGRYARGFKAGGFDTTLSSTANPGSRLFDPETLDSFEVGIKSRLWDDRVQLNVAAFYLDWKDKQEQFFNGIEFITSNAASADNMGLEIELVARLSEAFTINFNVGFQDGKYDEFVDPIVNTDLSGDQLPGAPDLTTFLGFNYESEIGGGWILGANASARYRSKEEDNPNPWAQDANTTVDARIALSSPGRRVTVALWGKNLTDEDHFLGGFSFFGTNYASINAPLTYGIELRAGL